MPEQIYMPNINVAQDLAVHLIDSDDERRKAHIEALRKMLPGASILPANHPENTRRVLQLLSEKDDRVTDYDKKYSVFLSADSFERFSGKPSIEFDNDPKSIKKATDYNGVFKMLKDYFESLTVEGKKFFSAILTTDSNNVEPGFCDEFDDEKHPLNFIAPKASNKPDSKITALQYYNDPEQTAMKLSQMFQHFDKLVGLNPQV